MLLKINILMQHQFLLFLLALLAKACSAYVEYVPERLTWIQAQHRCSSNGGLLKLPQETDLRSLRPYLIHSDATIWLGGSKIHTPWRWTDGSPLYQYVGCYSVDKRVQSSVLQGTFAEVFECLRLCRGESRYLMINGVRCACLPEFSRLEAVSNSLCSTFCPNEYNESCGGPGVFSVYKYDTDNFRWSSDTSTLQANCAYLYLPGREKPSLGDVELRTDRCDSTSIAQRPSLCETCSSMQQRCSISRTSAYRTWQSAQQSCHLAKVSKGDNPPFQLRVGTPEYYWIGLTRFMTWRWTNGSEIHLSAFLNDVKDQVGDCLVASRESMHLYLKRTQCNERYTFLCEYSGTLSSLSGSGSTKTFISPNQRFTLASSLHQSAATTVQVSLPRNTQTTTTPVDTTMHLHETTQTTTTPVDTTMHLPETRQTAITPDDMTTHLPETSVTAKAPITTKVFCVSETTSSDRFQAASLESSPLQSTSPTSSQPIARTATTTTTSTQTPLIQYNKQSSSTTMDKTSPGSTSVRPSDATSAPVNTVTAPYHIGDSSSSPVFGKLPPLTTAKPGKTDLTGLYIGFGILAALIILGLTLVLTLLSARRHRRRKSAILHERCYENDWEVNSTDGIWSSGFLLEQTENSLYGKTQKRVRLKSFEEIHHEPELALSSKNDQTGSDIAMSGSHVLNIRSAILPPDPIRTKFEPETETRSGWGKDNEISEIVHY